MEAKNTFNNTVNFVPEDLRPPVHDTERFFNAPLKVMNPADLATAIMLECRGEDFERQRLVALGIELSAHLHHDQTRGGGVSEKPYIAHPLRNALRLIRYGCTDTEIIAATLLHDTVEDRSPQMYQLLYGTITKNKPVAREGALKLISELFSPETARIVQAVTNPTWPDGLSKVEKHQLYLEHVKEIIVDPKVFLVKFTDWVDNGVGLHHTENLGMVLRLASKYSPLAKIFYDQLVIHIENNALPLPQSSIVKLFEHIELGEKRLKELADLSS